MVTGWLRIFCIFALTFSLIACGGGGGGSDSDSGTPSSGTVRTIEMASLPEGADAFTEADETELYNLLLDYAYAVNQAISLTNASLYADPDATSPSVFVARSTAALEALDRVNSLCKQLETFETEKILPVTESLPTVSSASAAPATAKMVKAATTGDTVEARRLLNIYLDPEYNAKFTLGQVAKKTGVSMARLRFLMGQLNDEYAQQINDVDIAEYEWKTDAAVKVRDTAATTNTALSIVATGGTSAGLLGISGRTIMIAEKASAIITLTEKGVSVVVEEDDVPPSVKAVFDANTKFSSFVLPAKNILTGNVDIGTVQGIVTDAGPTYVDLFGDDDKVKVSDAPINPGTPKVSTTSTPEDAAATLPAGRYKIPTEPIPVPDYLWDDTFWTDFYEGTITDLTDELVKLADLWDLTTATTDEWSWDFSTDVTFEEVDSAPADDLPLFFVIDPGFEEGTEIAEPAPSGTEKIMIFTKDRWTDENITSIPQGVHLTLEVSFSGFAADFHPRVRIDVPGNFSFDTSPQDSIVTGISRFSGSTSGYYRGFLAWSEPGSKTITVTAYTEDGSFSLEKTATINVTPLVNRAPKITGFSVDKTSGRAPFKTCYTVEYDDEFFFGSTAETFIDFSDGNGMLGGRSNAACYTYDTSGTYTISAFVRDYGYPTGTREIIGYTDETNPRLDSETRSLSITVLPPEPTDYQVSLTTDPSPADDTPIEGDFPFTVGFVAEPAGSFDDANTEYTWNFGDGSPEVTVSPGEPGHSSYSCQIEHIYTEPGTYTATVSAQDAMAVTATDGADILVTTPTLQEMIYAAAYDLEHDPTMTYKFAVIPPGTYKENVTIPASTVISSSDPDDPSVVMATVIEGDGTGPVVTMKRASTLEGFTIQGGTTGILFDGEHQIVSKNRITDNTGPGIRGPGSVDSNFKYLAYSGWAGTIVDNEIFANQSPGPGGGISIASTYSSIGRDDEMIARNKIYENSASDGGGIYCKRAESLITDNSIEKNVASRKGGGIYIDDFSAASAIDNIVSENSATSDGGGIYIQTFSGRMTGNDVLNNSSTAGSGGGLAFFWGSGQLEGNVFSGNSANRYGGGIDGYELTGKLADNVILGNSSRYQGGGFYLNALKGTLDGNQIENNQGSKGGGGYVHNTYPESVITNNTVTGNTARLSCGGLYLGYTWSTGGLSLADFSGNSVTGNTVTEPEVGDSTPIDICNKWGESY